MNQYMWLRFWKVSLGLSSKAVDLHRTSRSSRSSILQQRCMAGLGYQYECRAGVSRGLTSQEKSDGSVVPKSPDDRWEEVCNRSLSLGHHVAEDHDVNLIVSSAYIVQKGLTLISLSPILNPCQVPISSDPSPAPASFSSLYTAT